MNGTKFDETSEIGHNPKVEDKPTGREVGSSMVFEKQANSYTVSD
jgi:hypothetical protein